MIEKNFHLELVALLHRFDRREITEQKLSFGLRRFAPADETWDIFRFRTERWTGEKFMTARERGLTLWDMQRNCKIPCTICHGVPCALKGTPVGSFVSGAHIKR